MILLTGRPSREVDHAALGKADPGEGRLDATHRTVDQVQPPAAEVGQLNKVAERTAELEPRTWP